MLHEGFKWRSIIKVSISVTDKSVLPFLTATGRVHWKGRGSFKTVVLTDDHSTTAILSQHSEGGGGGEGSFLLMLKDSLFKVSPF